jgi:hypothetical protein
MPTRCNRWFLLQILLLAQHVLGITMPIIRRVICPVCGHITLLMMGIVTPETCWASNKLCNKNHLLHLVGILFPHIRLYVICCTWWQKQRHHPKHCILTNCGSKKWKYRFHLNNMCVSQTFRLSFHNLSSTYNISLYPEYCLLQVLFAHVVHSVHVLKRSWVWSWYSIAASLPFRNNV